MKSPRLSRDFPEGPVGSRFRHRFVRILTAASSPRCLASHDFLTFFASQSGQAAIREGEDAGRTVFPHDPCQLRMICQITHDIQGSGAKSHAKAREVKWEMWAQNVARGENRSARTFLSRRLRRGGRSPMRLGRKASGGLRSVAAPDRAPARIVTKRPAPVSFPNEPLEGGLP